MSSFPAGASAIATSSSVLEDRSAREAEYFRICNSNSITTSRDSRTSAPPPTSLQVPWLHPSFKAVEGQEKPKALETQDPIRLGCTSVGMGSVPQKTTSVQGA